MKKQLNVGDVDSALESGFLHVTSLPSSLFSKDKDDDRDREVDAAIMYLNYLRVKDDISKVVSQTIETLYENPRLIKLIGYTNHVGLTDEVIKKIYKKYYSK